MIDADGFVPSSACCARSAITVAKTAPRRIRMPIIRTGQVEVRGGQPAGAGPAQLLDHRTEEVLTDTTTAPAATQEAV
ncbi:hypothetical protein, partial [Streptomyces sp. NPDC056663]|uniref:hypothetical protein n=1 Tax=Streptomyces sp. NPDC056663 TaxID=3345899 RepID=UPI003694D4F7